MLLDFLTDRMQIWRVMKDVSDLDFAADVPLVEKEAKTQFAPAEERDAVQIWWADVVDPLCVLIFRLLSLINADPRVIGSAPMSTLPSSRTTASSSSPPQRHRPTASRSGSSPPPRPSRRARSSRSRSLRGAASCARASAVSPRARR